MKVPYPHYNIEHLHDTSNVPLDFEALVFDKAEVFLKATSLKEFKSYHMHSFYSIIWTDKGTCTQYIDETAYAQKENSLLFICPGQMHINQVIASDDLSGGVLMFSPDFFSLLRSSNSVPLELNFLDSFYTNPLLQLSEKEFSLIKQTINSIISEKQHPSSQALIIQSLLLALVMQVQRFIDEELTTHFPKQSLTIYKQFKSLLEKHYKGDWSIEDYASHVNISSRHLNRLIKETTGKTITQLIRNRVILEAKRLLLYTSLSISEISATLGYVDDSYFNKVFKKEIGSTPSSFRKQMSE